MDIFKIIIISFLSVSMCMILRHTRPELALLTALMTIIVIMFFSLNYIGQIVELIKDLSSKAGLPGDVMGIILKIIGISYIVEFAVNVCKDSGESAVASKIELAGKCVILVLGITIIGNFVDTISQIV